MHHLLPIFPGLFVAATSPMTLLKDASWKFAKSISRGFIPKGILPLASMWKHKTGVGFGLNATFLLTTRQSVTWPSLDHVARPLELELPENDNFQSLANFHR
jgi:hypothetical protein